MGESPLDLAFAVLEEMPVGVIVISDDGRVAHYNRYEEMLAERKRENVLGKLFFDEVAPCLKAKQLKEPILEGIRTGELNLEEEVSFDYRFLEVPREVILRARVFASGGRNFALLLLEDIGERRALERLRTTLGALLARDMKSPLRAAIGRLSEVEQELRDPPELAEHLFEAKRALKRVERMVEGLFEIARLETGTFPMNRKMTDVGEVLGDAVQEHARLADARRVRLVCETDEEAFPLLSLDGDLVRRAVGHLIANGVSRMPRAWCLCVRGMTKASCASRWKTMARASPMRVPRAPSSAQAMRSRPARSSVLGCPLRVLSRAPMVAMRRWSAPRSNAQSSR